MLLGTCFSGVDKTRLLFSPLKTVLPVETICSGCQAHEAKQNAPTLHVVVEIGDNAEFLGVRADCPDKVKVTLHNLSLGTSLDNIEVRQLGIMEEEK